MSERGRAMHSDVAVGVVDDVDLDAVAEAVRGCGSVDDLDSGPCGGVVSYLPRRQVRGVRVASDHVVISVRGQWGVPVTELARQIRTALAAVVAPRRVDIVLAALGEAAAETPAGLNAANAHRDEVGSWTTSSHGDVPGASSSAPIIPTTVAIPTPSPLA
jgi:hypothetical protein